MVFSASCVQLLWSYFSDQSCTDILHLYHKLRSEVSSEEETVSACSELHIFTAILDFLGVSICALAGLTGWPGHRLRHSRNLNGAPGNEVNTDAALQTEVRYENLSCSFSFVFTLAGSKLQEAWCGFRREGLAKSVPRTAAKNGCLPWFRTF